MAFVNVASGVEVLADGGGWLQAAWLACPFGDARKRCHGRCVIVGIDDGAGTAPRPARSSDLIAGRPASAIVADGIRHDIMHGALEDGQRLRQDAIATRFGVSQMIVREAFQQLVTEGFLTSEPRRGVSVAPLTADEAWEMTQLRSLIEGQALEWAVPAMTEADLASATLLLDELDHAGTTDAIIGLNARFHETLYAPARRERTLLLVRSLRLNFERYLRFTWDETAHLTASQDQHRQIVALCRTKEAGAASALLRHHIVGTGTLLVERLRLRSKE